MSRQTFVDRFQSAYSKEDVDVSPASAQSNVQAISTGILSFDTATGIAGFPRGRPVELFGPESGGKSLVALVSVAHLQSIHPESSSLYFDIEGSTPKEWLATLGINLDRFDVVAGGLCAEQYFEAIYMAIEERAYDYIIIDSVAGLITRAELEGTVDKHYMAELARCMSKCMKKLVSTLAMIPNEEAPCVLFINQVRERPGVMYGNPETTPGGKALNFYAAQRYRVIRKPQSEVSEGGDVVGHSIVVKNVKNKLGPPKREGEFAIHYTKGVDIARSIMNMVKQRKLYTKVGQKYHLLLDQPADEPLIFDSVGEITNKVSTDKEFQTRVYNFLMQNYIGITESKTDKEPAAETEEVWV